MATYSDTSFDANRYDAARPSYPDKFYSTLMKYHNGKDNANTDLAVDIGCGSGFVAFKLGQYFSEVIGTDISETMIKKCITSDNKPDRIQFYVAPAEESPEQIKPGTVSLLTGAECCHWVDHARFFKEAARVLQPGTGTLAYWFYKDPIFVDYPKANEIYDKYCYLSDESEGWEKYMGPSWEQPGRNFLRTLLREIEVPSEYFEDVVRHEFHAGKDDKNSTTLYIARTVTPKDILSYVQSWSAYHTWMAKNGSNHQDVAVRFVEELKQEMGWTDDTKIEIVWDTVYTFARRK